MDNTINRRRLLQLTAVGIGGSIAGCSDSQDGSPETTDSTGDSDGSQATPTDAIGEGEVNVLTGWSSDRWQSRWEEVVSEFEGEYGVQASVTYSGAGEELRRRLSTLLQAGNAPEMMTSGSITNLGTPLIDGQVAPMTETVSEVENSLGTIPDNLKNLVTLNGEVWCIPYSAVAGNVMLYRKDVYDQLGLDVPETWDDLLSNVRAIASSDLQIAPIAVPGKTGGGKSNNDFIGYLRTAGGGLFEWQSDGYEKPLELWYDQEHVVDALNYMNELAQFSPDPSSLDWAPTARLWAGGRIAHCMSANAWFAGVAASAGANQVARNSEIAVLPTRDGQEVMDRGWINVGGMFALSESAGSDNVGGARALGQVMMQSPNAVASNHLADPTRRPPLYESVMNSDTYQNAEVFQLFGGHLLDLNRRLVNDIYPEMGNRRRLISHPASLAISNQQIRVQSNMVNRVLVQDQSPESSYQTALSEMESLVADGNEAASDFLNS